MDEPQAGLQFFRRLGCEKIIGRAADPEARMVAQADPALQRALRGFPEQSGD